MNKNIKRIISTIIITLSIFTLVGCGQTKEELKEEIKQEIKAEENNIDNGNSDIKEVEITKEDLIIFENLFKEYNLSKANTINFVSPEASKDHITLEEGKELKAKSDIVKEEFINSTPTELKEIVNSFTSAYDDYFNYCVKDGRSPEDVKNKLIEGDTVIKSKIAELHTQLDNK